MYRIAFVMEQALGHVTHTQNLQRNVPGDLEVEPLWLLIPFDLKGRAAKAPLYRSNWTVRAGRRDGRSRGWPIGPRRTASSSIPRYRPSWPPIGYAATPQAGPKASC